MDLSAYPGMDLFGIPVPTSHPGFLVVLGVHVGVALVAFLAGAVAILVRKGAGRHLTAGSVYFWSLALVTASAAGLTAFRPAENWPLLLLGAGAWLSAWYGRAARRQARRGWVRTHVVGMGTSYILMLTAFYVDNGPHLPVWDRLPPWAFWVLPAAVGVPLVLRSLFRHPLARPRGSSDL